MAALAQVEAARPATRRDAEALGAAAAFLRAQLRAGPRAAGEAPRGLRDFAAGLEAAAAVLESRRGRKGRAARPGRSAAGDARQVDRGWYPAWPSGNAELDFMMRENEDEQARLDKQVDRLAGLLPLREPLRRGPSEAERDALSARSEVLIPSLAIAASGLANVDLGLDLESSGRYEPRWRHADARLASDAAEGPPQLASEAHRGRLPIADTVAQVEDVMQRCEAFLRREQATPTPDDGGRDDPSGRPTLV